MNGPIMTHGKKNFFGALQSLKHLQKLVGTQRVVV